MDCKFVVGQKVLCIDDLPQHGIDPRHWGLQAGDIYTIDEICIGELTGSPILFLVELKHPKDEDGYSYALGYERFRALDDKLLEPFREYCRTREDALGGLICDTAPLWFRSMHEILGDAIKWGERQDPERW